MPILFSLNSFKKNLAATVHSNIEIIFRGGSGNSWRGFRVPEKADPWEFSNWQAYFHTDKPKKTPLILILAYRLSWILVLTRCYWLANIIGKQSPPDGFPNLPLGGGLTQIYRETQTLCSLHAALYFSCQNLLFFVLQQKYETNNAIRIFIRFLFYKTRQNIRKLYLVWTDMMV